MAGQTSTGPVKVYEVVKNSTFTYRELEIRHNGTPFLWINLETHVFSSSMMTFHTQGPDGPVVAGTRFPKMAGGVDVTIGDPSAAKDENYVQCEPSSMMGSSYRFPGVGTGQYHEWTRTHSTEYGSTRLLNSDFKLRVCDGEQVLAVYIKDSFMGGPSVAHIDFFVTLDPDLELQAIAAILGIEEKLRRKRRNGAGGAGGGASASASAGAGNF